MNYRHLYHAGNFADVFKHLLLIELIKSLSRKENPFCLLDTHAGAGCYDLASSGPQTTKEFETGIKMLRAQKNTPAIVSEFLTFVQQLNNPQKLRFYPGSPLIAQHFLREQDRMIFSELHPEECALLKKSIGHDKRAAIHVRDGYESLKAFLPPKERRGLILIDPPYEKANEFLQITEKLPHAVKRFETGVFALWYPIKQGVVTERFYRHLQKELSRPTLIVELCIYPDDTPIHLNGSGMLIVNPPWQLAETLQKLLPWLWETLSVERQGRYLIA